MARAGDPDDPDYMVGNVDPTGPRMTAMQELADAGAAIPARDEVARAILERVDERTKITHQMVIELSREGLPARMEEAEVTIRRLLLGVALGLMTALLGILAATA